MDNVSSELGWPEEGNDFYGESNTSWFDGAMEEDGSGYPMDLYNATINATFNATVDPEIERMKIALEGMRFVVQSILVPLVTVIGVLGNITTILVLTRRHMRSSTNFYLTALALSDMLYLFLHLYLSLQHHPGFNEPYMWHYWEFSRFAMWLTDAASATSTWLTVTFTIERYIAVCHPIKGKVFCTPSRAKRVIVCVFLLCFSLTATTPHEWTVSQRPSNDSYVLILDTTALGRDDTYRTIFFWFSSVMFTLLPLLLLSIFNSFLINTVNKSRVHRKTLTERPRHEKGTSRSQSQEKKITLMLIAVVVLALICQTPAAIALLYSSFHQPIRGSRDDLAMRILGNLFNLMTACNAALNFVLYCALSDKFRKTFVEVFCQSCAEKPSPQHSFVHTNYTEDHSPRMSRNSSVHYSRRNSNSRRSSNSSGVSRLSPVSRTPVHTGPPGQQYLAVPHNNHHPGGDQAAPLLNK